MSIYNERPSSVHTAMMGSIIRQLLFFAFAVQACLFVGAQTTQPHGVPFRSPVTVAPGLSASVIFSNLTTPRGITFDDNGNLLVVERGLGLTAFSLLAEGGYERTVVVQNTGFTQGVQVDGGKLYVSTAGEVLQYNYDSSSKTVSGEPDTVVTGLPPDGDLTTHTLQLQYTSGDATDILMASGPFTNIDPTARDPSSGRSQIRRFPISSFPTTYEDGEVIAYGIRNPAGFAFSPFPSYSNELYVVENGASIDNVTGLTAQFVNDNPADELELVKLSSTYTNTSDPPFYGFPDCTTLWNPDADPTGDPQYTNLERGDQISLHLEAERDDEWCRDVDNNIPPVLSFQAHSVPLDIKFYHPTSNATNSSLPTSYNNSAFVSFHGSFNRSPPTGYGVVRVPFPLANQSSGSDLGYEFLIQATNLTSCPGTCIRPVGLAFGKDGRLYVSSDSSGELFVLESG